MPEDRPGAEYPRANSPDRPPRAPHDMPVESAPNRPRPRSRPPSTKPPASKRPALAFESQSLSERLLPPVFFGFIVLAIVAGVALFFWTPEPSTGYELTAEELQVLSGEERSQTRDAQARTSSELGDSQRAPTTDAGGGVLQVETNPSGAVVAIDGQVVGVTPLLRERLPVRWHLISVERAGFSAQDTLVYLEEGAPTSISLALVPVQTDMPVSPSSPVTVRQPQPEMPEASTASVSPSQASRPSAPTSGSISVAVNPSGVPVQLDGETVGVAPMELSDVSPGVHTLTFFLPGFETATVEVSVEPGVREAVDIALVPQTGTLTVVVRPWGSIFVGGTLRAKDTDVSVEVTLPVGTHQVRVEHPTLGSQERTVEIRPERTTSEVFDLN